ncbi:MAG: HAMP domain-containing sensor histidine kinase [Gemmatimonadaceae bacterium]
MVSESELGPAALAREDQYRFLADAIPVQVWTALPTGALDYVNRGVTEYFQRSAEQILGEGWLAMLHPDDVAPTVERWTHSVTTGAPYEIEFRLFHLASNEFRWHLGRAIAQLDDAGSIVKWYGSNTDIEDNKRAARDLQRLHEEALEANRAKSDFLTAMSHELRTPLNAIGGYAQLLEMGLRGPVTEEQRIDLRRIDRSQKHLLGLINDVLNFAKLGAGKMEYVLGDVPTRELVESVSEMIGSQIEAKGLRLTTGTCVDGLAVRADADRLRQVIINLVGNAIKFTPEGGEISVVCEARDAHVAISVRDSGVGIAEDKLASIFEPFVQVGRKFSTNSEGVGLGLTISRAFARGMGGELTVESAAGAGATFTITLPAAEQGG